MQYLLREIPDDLWEQFRAICQRRGRTASGVLREFIAKTVEAEQPPRLNARLFDSTGEP